MNVYIYDDFLNKSKYSRAINRVEIRLTDLGLNGKIIRLGAIKNIHDSVENEIKNGAKTIIAVGNNQTIYKTVAAVIEHQALDFLPRKTLFAIIPIGDQNSVAESLGIKKEEESCNVVLARRIKKIDVGVAGRHYFLEKAEIEAEGAILEINDEYTIEITEKGVISIINLYNPKDFPKNLNSHPDDRLLDIYIKTKNRSESFFSVKKIKILNKDKKIILDDSVEVKTPIEIGVLPEGLELIVGKERLFE